MSSKRARNRSGHLSKSTLNGLTLVVILASIICSVIIIIFIYQHLCRRKRRRKRDGDGYTAVGVSDPYEDDDGGWTSYDSNALDWDPEEARVKRRLNVVEKRKKKLTKQVELLDQQLTARREALDRVSDHSSQLTSRLNTARDQPTGIGSNIGNIPADSPALAAIDAKGKEMFGDKWMKGENGGPPMRSILGLAPEDLEQIKRGLETARAEATSSSSSRRSSGRDQRGNGTAANINSQMGDNDYEDHSQLLARTSILADRLRAATSQNTPRRR
jgi:hypothetical protein